MIPIEALTLVAVYIEPDPVRYFELATINRTFYSVFMSDRLWLFLNPYGLECGIAADFAYRILSDTPEYRRALVQKEYIFPNDKYVQLMQMVHNRCALNINDEQLAWCAVNIRGQTIQCLSPALRDHYDIVMAAVQQDGAALAWASPALKRNLQIVLAAIASNPAAVNYADIKSVHKGRRVLELLNAMAPGSVDYYGNGVVHLGMPNIAYTLMKMSDELRDDKEIVKAAIAKSGGAIRYASPRLQQDKELMLMAVSKEPEIIYGADPKLMDDFDIVLAAVKQRGFSLIWASTRLKDDEEIVKTAIQDSPNVLRFASPRLQRKFSTLLALGQLPVVGPVMGPVMKSLYSVFPF